MGSPSASLISGYWAGALVAAGAACLLVFAMIDYLLL